MSCNPNEPPLTIANNPHPTHHQVLPSVTAGVAKTTRSGSSDKTISPICLSSQLSRRSTSLAGKSFAGSTLTTPTSEVRTMPATAPDCDSQQSSGHGSLSHHTAVTHVLASGLGQQPRSAIPGACRVLVDRLQKLLR